MKAINSVSEGGGAEHFTVQLKTYDFIVLQAYLQTTQNSPSHSQRDEYTIFSDIFLLAILRTRAANSRAQVFLMAYISTDIKLFQIPVLKSPVFPDILLLI